ncbi:I78 family peptidase inhibitor [Nitrobacter sp.]|uniref:I78 family peptidase inhibitor n=1 Tax=Nitrobacter sp. TaxID=29420 RepID=UPI003F64F7AB
MKTKLISTATLVLAVSTVAWQAGAGGAGSASRGICRPDAAKALTGMARLTDRQAKKMTGATIVRQISPGQGVTMDYRRERVTIETDPKTGKIVRAFCG